MAFNDNEFAGDGERQQTNPHIQPNVQTVDEDEDNIKQKDLEKNYLFGKGDFKPNPTEGQPVGGEKFGEENKTPSGDDKNNPSRNAGYSNAYFARTEPMEEHPENSNFTANDEGVPDYSKAQPQASNNDPKPEKVERGNGENDRPKHDSPYHEKEQAENEQENIPGPQELPDQQKVGEDDEEDNEGGHIET
jgi:hypothetical protein